jgi:tetratricopeptide (TPR) repeat protein
VNAVFALAWFGEDIGAMTALADHALALNPNFARGWFTSGSLRSYAGQQDIAIEHIEAALRLSPRARVEGSLLMIGFAHFLSRRFDQAVPKLLQAIQEDPSEHKTYGRVADSGFEIRFHFCPNCGSSVFWKGDRSPLWYRGRLFRRPGFPGADLVRLGRVDACLAGSPARNRVFSASSLLKLRRWALWTPNSLTCVASMRRVSIPNLRSSTKSAFTACTKFPVSDKGLSLCSR